MNSKLIVLLKAVAVAGLAEAGHYLAENIDQITPLIPPKYAGLGSILIMAAGLYLKQSPVKKD